MHLLIIYPDIIKGANWSGYFYVGIGYLAAVAKRAGHTVELMHITKLQQREMFQEEVIGRVDAHEKVLIAFSTTTNMFHLVQEWSTWIKERRDNFILVGGVHATLVPEEVIATPSIDGVCIGEGEAPLLEVMSAIENDREVIGIQNIWVKKDGKIIKMPLRPLNEDLDLLPFPDRTVFDYKSLDLERKGIGVFMASRGCPYNCYYCCNHSIKKQVAGGGNYVRFRSVDNVINEIRQVLDLYSFLRIVHFDDDILPLNKKWFREFCQQYSSRIGLPFICNIRPNLIDEEIISLLKISGCAELRIGLESGNPYILSNILNRGDLSIDTIIKAASLCRQAGIRLFTFNMVGLPEETMARRLDTIKLNARIKSDIEQVFIFYPYEKTKLFDIAMEQGLIKNKEVKDVMQNSSLNFDWISEQQVIFSAYFFSILICFYRKIFNLPMPVSRFLIKVLDAFLCSKITATIIYPITIFMIRQLRRNKSLETWGRNIKHMIAGWNKSNGYLIKKLNNKHFEPPS